MAISSFNRNRALQWWPWLLVLAVLLFSACIRLRLLDVPLERDEGEYAYAGQLILHGIPPYELAYNMKLPGTYLAYALGMAAFGQTIAGVHLTLLVANSFTIIFVFLLGRKLFGNLAGVVACAAYAVMALSSAVAGLAAHANHFVVLLAVPGILLLKAGETGNRKTLFASGLLLGLAFLMKQQGICFGFFGVVFLSWMAARRRELLTRRFAGRLLTFGAGLALPFGLTCLVLAMVGVFGRFWFWTMVYAAAYETAIPIKTGLHDYLGEHLRDTRDLSIGFWFLVLAGLLAAFWQRSLRKPMGFVLAFWLFSFLGTAAGFYFRAHYFILLLPAFALLVGLSVVALQSAWRPKRLAGVVRSLPLIAFGLALSWMIYYQAQPFFQWSPVQVCRNFYTQNPFVEAVAAAQLLRDHSAPDARVAVFGSEPEIYFYANRRSATGYIYTYALMEVQPHALDMQRDMAREIETNQPQFLVLVPYYLSWLLKTGSTFYIDDWFTQYSREHYDKVGAVGFDSNGKLTSLWSDTANLPPVPLPEHITLYRRKS